MEGETLKHEAGNIKGKKREDLVVLCEPKKGVCFYSGENDGREWSRDQGWCGVRETYGVACL